MLDVAATARRNFDRIVSTVILSLRRHLDSIVFGSSFSGTVSISCHIQAGTTHHVKASSKSDGCRSKYDIIAVNLLIESMRPHVEASLASCLGEGDYYGSIEIASTVKLGRNTGIEVAIERSAKL